LGTNFISEQNHIHIQTYTHKQTHVQTNSQVARRRERRTTTTSIYTIDIHRYRFKKQRRRRIQEYNDNDASSVLQTQQRKNVRPLFTAVQRRAAKWFYICHFYSWSAGTNELGMHTVAGSSL